MRHGLQLCAFIFACASSACSSDVDGSSDNRYYFSALVDGRPFVADTGFVRWEPPHLLTISATDSLSVARVQSIVTWVDSLALPGTYTLQGDAPADGDAMFQDDPDPSAPGFVGFRPLSKEPGWIRITALDTITHSLTASFAFMGREYLPTFSDSGTLITGSLHLPYIPYPR